MQFHFYEVLRLIKIIETEVKMVGTREWDEVEWEVIIYWIYNFSFIRWAMEMVVVIFAHYIFNITKLDN